MTRRKFLLGLAAATAATTGLGGAALARNAQRNIVVTHHEAHLSGASGLRLVHLTDVHIGWSTSEALLVEAAERCGELEPSLVVLTGDYVNHSLKDLDRLEGFVSSLPKPVVATLGNHDHWTGAEAVRGALENGGAIVLQNEHRIFDVGGVRLPIVGVDDGFTGRDDVAAAVSDLKHRERALALTHYPETAEGLSEEGIPLVLAGHTHGGQIDVPYVTPALARRIGNKYLAGWYQIGETKLFVNVGIGTGVTPWRVGRRVAPELACIDFR